MKKTFSIYLDATRFLAAVFVVITHYVQHSIINEDTAYYIPDLGREAVIIFFVLSGFVIAYISDTREQSLSEYAIARAARIYSVALPLILISFFVVFISTKLSIESELTNYQLDKAYIYIPFHAVFLGEIWNFSEQPPWLVPYWSLNYEVWYYIFYASVFYFRGVKRILISASILVLIGHKLWLLMPIWWTGVLLYKYKDIISINKFYSRLGLIASIVAIILFRYFDLDILLREIGNDIWPFEQFKLGSADRYLNDYVISVIVLFNFYFAYHSEMNFLIPNKKWISNLATYTFTIYLSHMLVIKVWMRIYAHNNNSFTDIVMLSLLIAVTTYILGMLTEHRKYYFKNVIRSLYEKFVRLKGGRLT